MYSYSQIMDDCIILCIVHQCNSGNLSWVKVSLLFLPLQDMVDTTMLISQLKFITALQTDTHAHLKCAYGYISNIWESIAFFVIRPDQINLLLLGFSEPKNGPTDRNKKKKN